MPIRSIRMRQAQNISPQRRISMHSLVPATHVAAFTSFAAAISRARKVALFLFSVALLLAGGRRGAGAIRARWVRSERQWQGFRRRRPTGREDSSRRRFYHCLGRGAQPHCPVESGRHARYRLRSGRERPCPFNRGAGGRQDSLTAAPASADRHAAISPGSIPPPARLIRSTRTRTVLSIPSRCRRTARFWRAAISTERTHRRTDAQPHRPARCHDRPD